MILIKDMKKKYRTHASLLSKHFCQQIYCSKISRVISYIVFFYSYTYAF